MSSQAPVPQHPELSHLPSHPRDRQGSGRAGVPLTPLCYPQLAMEALEQEQQSLRVQIARVLEDRQQLMHLKMSLSLEVATYR